MEKENPKVTKLTKTFKIANMKTGHSVNSSSSHSIIIVKNPVDYSSIQSDSEDGYNWDGFLLTQKQEKLRYLSAMIDSQYSDLSILIRETLKKLNLVDLDYTDLSVDHQSVCDVPGIELTQNCTDYKIDAIKFNDFLEAYMSENVFVVGGNDNSPEDAPDVDGTPVSFSDLSISKNGNTICLFDKSSGTRVTLSEDDEIKLDYPMLLDLKITDYCAISTCAAACYQNSTTDGKHCDMKYIQELSYFIKEAKVFEIAIGGGEPTQHPYFDKIVSLLSQHTNVNFTTRNKEFLIDNYLKKKNPIYEKVGFALSIDSISDLVFLSQFKNCRKGLVNAQYIVGQNNEEFLKRLITKAYELDLNLILLGWKNVGRGNTRTPFEIKDPYKHILKYKGRANISVDTAFFERYGHEVIPNRIKITEEGVYSSYIDCIEKKLYKSSYHLEQSKDFSNPSKVDNFFDYSTIEKKTLNVIY